MYGTIGERARLRIHTDIHIVRLLVRSAFRVLYGCSRTIQLLLMLVMLLLLVFFSIFYLLFAFRMGSMCRWQRMRWQLNKWMESNWIRYTYPYSYKARTAHLRLRSPVDYCRHCARHGFAYTRFPPYRKRLHRTQYSVRIIFPFVYISSLRRPLLCRNIEHANQKSEIWCSCARNENGKRWLSTRI